GPRRGGARNARLDAGRDRARPDAGRARGARRAPEALPGRARDAGVGARGPQLRGGERRAGAERRMKLSEVSIQRPVLATVMSLAIILIGALSFTFLPVREYPDIDSPVVSVT